MKYEQKIISEDGGYKGFLLKNGEVIAGTIWCKTLPEASVRTRRLQEEELGNTNSNSIPSIPMVKHAEPTATFKRPANLGCCNRR